MNTLPHCLSELPFAALLVYSPRGESDTSKRSRQVRDAVKHDWAWPGQNIRLIRFAVERLKTELDTVGLARFFGEDVSLVPAPRSALRRKDALWPGRRICEELERVKLGGPILDCLERTHPVQKAAFASESGRPRPTVAEHLGSIQCHRSLLTSRRLLVVDDFVTRGTMLIAAASHLQAAFPETEVKAFALLRTKSTGDVAEILDPCSGVISYEGGEYARREP